MDPFKLLLAMVYVLPLNCEAHNAKPMCISDVIHNASHI